MWSLLKTKNKKKTEKTYFGHKALNEAESCMNENSKILQWVLRRILIIRDSYLSSWIEKPWNNFMFNVNLEYKLYAFTGIHITLHWIYIKIALWLQIQQAIHLLLCFAGLFYVLAFLLRYDLKKTYVDHQLSMNVKISLSS